MAQPGDKIPALHKHNAVALNQIWIQLPSWILIDRLTLQLVGLFLLVDHHNC